MTVQIADPPVRINMPVEIGPYTFTDRDGVVINLTTDFVAASVSCEIKRKGDAYSALTVLSGSFIVAANGTVHVTSYTHTASGIWTYQFYCVNGSAQKLWGEPVQYEVAGNVPQMDVNTLLTK